MALGTNYLYFWIISLVSFFSTDHKTVTTYLWIFLWTKKLPCIASSNYQSYYILILNVSLQEISMPMNFVKFLYVNWNIEKICIDLFPPIKLTHQKHFGVAKRNLALAIMSVFSSMLLYITHGLSSIYLFRVILSTLS
jgi:hypothetical protein